MAIRASGSRQVRAMEVTLGGRLSKAAAKRPGAELARHVRERLARRKAHWNELKPLLAQARAPFVELLKKDKRSVASAGALRAALAYVLPGDAEPCGEEGTHRAFEGARDPQRISLLTVTFIRNGQTVGRQRGRLSGDGSSERSSGAPAIL